MVLFYYDLQITIIFEMWDKQYLYSMNKLVYIKNIFNYTLWYSYLRSRPYLEYLITVFFSFKYIVTILPKEIVIYDLTP